MKNLSHLVLAFALAFTLIASGCGAKKKENSNDLGRTGQGQRDGENRGTDVTPELEQRLKVFCNNKPGSRYFGAPTYLCKFKVTVFAPKDEELAKLTEITEFPLFVAPEHPMPTPSYIQVRAKLSDGYAYVYDAKSGNTLMELDREFHGWAMTGDGQYKIAVWPGARGILVYAQACVNINMNYYPCQP